MNLDLFRDLFVHRSDVFAVQQPNGMYFPAGDHHFDPETKRTVYDSYYPLTDDELAEHLGGQASYGVYVIQPEGLSVQREPHPTVDGSDEPAWLNVPGNTVKYLVFDLDTYDEGALEWLVNCVGVLLDALPNTTRGNRRHSLILENSGGKGYHVWLCLSEPVEARRVRQWVARDFMPSWREKADEFPGSPLEIFPKQDAPPVLGGFGNLVKLPLGVHAVSGKRSEFIDLGQGWASCVDNVQKLDASLIPAIQEGPQPRKDGTSRPSTRTTGVQGESGPTPFACISHIIENGAPSGMRDNAMFHFARYAAGAGIPEDLVLEWCLRVNEEFDPPLTEREVAVKVRSAFAMESPHPGCNADWLRGFCPGGEKCFAPWNEERVNNRRPQVDDGSDYLSLSPHERRLLRGSA